MSTTTSTANERIDPDDPLAEKSTTLAIALAILLSPAAYFYLGRTKLGVINLLTLNYLALGFVIVPVHTYMIVSNNDARSSAANE